MVQWGQEFMVQWGSTVHGSGGQLSSRSAGEVSSTVHGPGGGLPPPYEQININENITFPLATYVVGDERATLQNILVLQDKSPFCGATDTPVMVSLMHTCLLTCMQWILRFTSNTTFASPLLVLPFYEHTAGPEWCLQTSLRCFTYWGDYPSP